MAIQPGLVPVVKQVKGSRSRRGYQAIRHISPGETKKRVKQYLEERKKESYTSKFMRETPLGVDIIYKDELEKNLEKVKDKKGNVRQFYTGNKIEGAKKVSVNVDLIKQVIEFKKPVEGCVALIERIGGIVVRQFMDEETEKNTKVKFERCKSLGKKIPEFQDMCSKLMQTKDPDKKQLGIVLSLMEKFDIRVGSGVGGVEEKTVPSDELKNRMLVKYPDWKEDVPPHMYVIKDGKPYLVNMEKAGEIDDQIKEIRDLPQKAPKDKKKIKALQKEKEDLKTPFPAKFTEMTILGHYGATQLQARHVKPISKDEVMLDFIGKSGKRWRLKVKDPVIISALLEASKGKTGQEELFPEVERRHVAKQLRKFKIVPKDFRSFHATKAFVEEYKAMGSPIPNTKRELQRIEKELLKRASTKLWNTPGVCKKAYIDPTVYTSWRAGMLGRLPGGMNKSLRFVIMEKAKPYARTRRGRIENVKGYPGRPYFTHTNGMKEDLITHELLVPKRLAHLYEGPGYAGRIHIVEGDWEKN